MVSPRRLDESPPRARSESGYTLVEMIIATAVAVIVGVGIYAIFNSQRRASEAQKIYAELQNSCGFAMDQIKRELLLAGYRSQFPASPVSVAGASTIAFDYWDDRAGAGAPFDDALYDRHTQVQVTLDPDGVLARRVKRWHTGSNAYEPSSIPFADLGAPYRQTLARNVQGLNFGYFRQNNEQWVSGTDPLADIRSVIVSLECRASKANPMYTDAARGIASDRYATVRLQSEVRLRNIGVEANPRDNQPPAVPAQLRVWDPGLCSPAGTVCGAPGAACASLELSWAANTESDLAGYNLYYGLASNSYSNRVRIARGPGAGGERIAYTLPGLQATKACDTTAATYFFRIEAFDRSGNPSPRSAEVFGNPSPSLSSESTSGNDTTINPLAAPAPTGFAASTPADNQIQLSWESSPVAGLVGYRLYRSQTGPGFTPVGAVAGVGNCIADERTLDQSATGFLDTGVFLSPALLQACAAYHYQLVAIHCDPCLDAADMNFASVTSTPTDSSPPPLPRLEAHDGWRRIVLTLNNPLRTVTPDFSHTKVWFSKAGFPTFDPATRSVSGGTLVPDAGGLFAADGTVTINFDSETVENPGPPALEIDATYYFLAIAFDGCGNPSYEPGNPQSEEQSRTVGEQCSDCLPSEACYGAPSAAFQIAATAGCADNLTLNWTGPDTTMHPDFYGFHLYRCAKKYHTECGDADWTELTSGYVWNPTYTDTKAQGLAEGQFASYRIRSTDCYYETHSLTWPATGDPDNDPADNYSDAYLDALYIGRIEREEMFPGPSARLRAPLVAADDRVSIESDTYSAANFPSAAGTGVRTILVGEEILSCVATEGPATIPPGVATASAFTGCVRGDQGTTAAAHASGAIVLPYPASRPIQAVCGNLAQLPPSFQHNTVEFRTRNTAAGPLTVTTLALSWQNPAAFLERIELGDDSTTPRTTVWSDGSLPLTHGAAGGVLTLSNAQVYGLDQQVPVALTFQNADGSVNALDNLREEQLTLDFVCRNESTGDASCADRLTVYVPLGPYIYGTTQDMPVPGTMSWAVPGAAGSGTMNAVVVPGQQMVNVYVNVSDSDYAGLREARLYYYVDAAKAYGSAPALDSGARYDPDPAVDNLAPYQRIGLVPVAGNQWRTPPGNGIPASNDANVWFFLVAVDNNGNFDREPEPGGGAFQYFQRPYNVCHDTPAAPVLTGSYTSSSVSLSWTTPLRNTDGTSWTDAGGFRVYRKSLASGPTKVGDVSAGTLTFTDAPPNMGSETYSYYVSAYDTCAPTANESSGSNWYTECHGAPTCAIGLHSSRNPLWSGSPGDSFTVDLSVCDRQNGVPGEYLYAQACSGADANPIRLVEDGDSGVFRIDAGSYLRSEAETWLTLPPSPGDLDLRVDAIDTVTVRGYASAAGGGWDTTCDTTLPCSASLSVVGDPCAAPVRPAAPTNLTLTIASSTCNKGNSGPVNLTWTAPATGPVSLYRIYRCIGVGCTPAPIGTSTTTSFTDANAGASLKANVFTYEVRAVNLACPTNVQESVGVSRAETCN